MRMLIAVVLASVTLAAQDSPRYKAHYVSGHTAWKGDFTGAIVVSPDVVTIVRVKTGLKYTDVPALVIPASQITSAYVTPQDDGKIVIAWESATEAEALYFRVESQDGPAIVAKINFARKHTATQQ